VLINTPLTPQLVRDGSMVRAGVRRKNSLLHASVVVLFRVCVHVLETVLLTEC